MKLGDAVSRLRTNENLWAVQKDWIYTREILLEQFGRIEGETAEEWHIACRHVIHSPASEQDIEQAQRQLGYALPEQLSDLLRLTNGAGLYCLESAMRRKYFPDDQYQRFKLYNVDEIVERSHFAFQRFRAVLGDDRDFKHIRALNYTIFCDAFNGNYLAILLDGSKKGSVIWLHREYFFRPYSKKDSDMYYTISRSLEAWLGRVVRSKGAQGFGRYIPPL